MEGGGDKNTEHAKCREGFKRFLEKTGLGGHMPRIIACGGRQNAYDSFCTSINNGDSSYLLVDSEDLVNKSHQQGKSDQWQPWAHLKARDSWEMPHEEQNEDCHLMTPCMESWLIADAEKLKEYFGQGFNTNALPPSNRSPEEIEKTDLCQALKNSTAHCKTKRPYQKGEHSFALLGAIDALLVLEKCPWAKRFIETLKQQ